MPIPHCTQSYCAPFSIVPPLSPHLLHPLCLSRPPMSPPVPPCSSQSHIPHASPCLCPPSSPPSHAFDIFAFGPSHHYYFCLVPSHPNPDAPLSAIVSVRVLLGICHIL